MIAFLRTNLTYAELAAGFGISPATCWHVARDQRAGGPGPPDQPGHVVQLAVKMGWTTS